MRVRSHASLLPVGEGDATVPAPSGGQVTVLYLNLYALLGGAERCLLELLAALDRRRFEPLVVLGGEGPLAAVLRERGIAVAVLPFPTPPLYGLLDPRTLAREISASLRIRRLVRASRAGIVHCGDVLALLLLLPARLGGVKVVFQVNYLGGPLRRLALNLLALAAADAVVAYSNDQREALRRGTVRLEARTTVVYPGIDPRAYEGGDRGRLRRELGLTDAVPLVGLLARYDTWKGHRVFLEAASRILEARPDARFMMAGGALNRQSLPHVGRYQREVLECREALGLTDAVSVLDHRDDVPSVLAALDVVVCPSEHEPFGLVVVEALAAGRPVVASDSGGPAEILEDGQSGLLFPTGDPGALAERVLRLLDDAALGRSLVEGGAVRVREAFHRERYAREIEELYARLA